MSEVKTVTITEEEYTRLIMAERWLNCLEAAGVDNWDGWDYAREMMGFVEEEDM